MVDPITAMLGISAAQTIASATGAMFTRDSEATVEAEDVTETKETFESFMRKHLDGVSEASMVNEEELFATLIGERLNHHVGSSAQESYSAYLQQEYNARRRSDGYIAVEDAANAALDRLMSEGIVTTEQHSQVRREAFVAADLDGNTGVLFDGRGEAGDPTIAKMSIEEALSRAQSVIESGEFPDLSQESMNVGTGDTITPSGQSVDGADGFVWKPEGDHSQKLVILLPAQMTGDVLDVVLKDQSGKEVERGVSSGVANGGREHFRFDRPGSDYQENMSVQVLMKDGTRKEYLIPNPSLRYD